MEHLIAGAAAGASNHETGAVTDDNDLGLMGGDDKFHDVDRDGEDLVAEAAAWKEHLKTGAVTVSIAVEVETMNHGDDEVGELVAEAALAGDHFVVTDAVTNNDRVHLSRQILSETIAG